MACCNAMVKWLDPFDVSSCCRADNFERDNGEISAWILCHSEGMRIAHPFLKQERGWMISSKVVLCKTCGRRWFRETEISVGGLPVEYDGRYWTVVSHGKKGA